MTDVTRRKMLAMAAAVGAFGLVSRPARADAPAAFAPEEIVDNGHRFFGSVSRGLAEAVQEAGRRWGLPNAYILGTGGLGRLRRRSALRRRQDVYEERRKPAGLLAGAVASASTPGRTATGR